MAPSKPKKLCHYPTCHRKTKDTYCQQHQAEAKSKSGWKKGKKTHPFYNHKIWRGSNPNKPLGQRGGLRELKLTETPYCERCKEKHGVINDVTGSGKGVVDHRIPWRSGKTKEERWNLFTDYENLQTLCNACHAYKTGTGK